MKFPKPTKKAAKKRKVTLAMCDKVAGQKVRDRRRCEARNYTDPRGHKVKCTEVLQWAHIVSRRYKSTRWDDDNAFCLCSAHHMFFTYRHVEWDEYVVFMIGQELYDELKKRSLEVFDGDYDAVLGRLRPAA